MPDFTVSASTTAATTLGTQASFTVTLQSTGAAGPVTLAVTGAPAGWTVAVTGSPATLVANGSASATVSVTIATTGGAAPAGQTLTVTATGPSGTHTATSVVTVANEYVVSLVSGSGAGAHWGALGGTLVQLKVGTRLTIRNDDSVDHNIHTSGSIPGFPHQNTSTSTPPGGTYSNVLTGPGSDQFNCHNHGGSGNVAVSVS